MLFSYLAIVLFLGLVSFFGTFATYVLPVSMWTLYTVHCIKSHTTSCSVPFTIPVLIKVIRIKQELVFKSSPSWPY